MSYITFNTDTDIINSSIMCQTLNTNGFLVYEYNPLKVFRVNKDTYIEDESGTHKLDKGAYVKAETGYKGTKYTFYPKNSILDLDTEKLVFNLTSPVDMEVQTSYDGSVNLILTDGKHQPRLINSRFACTGDGQYQISDRVGDNDTNIYDETSFETEISLHKRINKIPKLTFEGLGYGGNMKVGNYTFYFKLADDDGNQSDVVAESGLVSCYIGNINDPTSQRGGFENENSYKTVKFTLSNLDEAYSYVNVYYVRTTGVMEGEPVTSSSKIQSKFYINNGTAEINITGFELTYDIPESEINYMYDLFESSKTQVQCQNMLFLGNIKYAEVPSVELSDLSLRICPHLYVQDSIGAVNENYEDPTGKFEYYNANNIYYKLGYWDEEIYRFGVVYILNDGSLSPVFNIRGTYNLTNNIEYKEYNVYDIHNSRQYIPVDVQTHLLPSGENSKGVVKINNSTQNIGTTEGTKPIGIQFKIPEDVVTELKKHTRGFFFVRQPRLKTTLCQAVSVGLDKMSNTPVLPIGNEVGDEVENYFAESFISEDRLLTHNFSQRIRKIKDYNVTKGGAAICPEYELNLPFFNQFFTVSKFTVDKAKHQFTQPYLNSKDRHYYNLDYSFNDNEDESYDFTITSVPDDTKYIKGDNVFFSARAGEAEDPTLYYNIGYKNKGTKATNILRGCFGSYIGMEGINKLDMQLLNIRIPGYLDRNLKEYFNIRFRDKSEFKAISDRLSWDDLTPSETNGKVTYSTDGIYRGDCFICNFTHRVIRNLTDPETPTIDEIVDVENWKNNYSYGEDDSDEKTILLSSADVNAVKVGHWVTFKVCSHINLSLRCVDPFHPTEYGMTGQPRAFYPLYGMNIAGNAKLPESQLMCAGFNKNLPSKAFFDISDTLGSMNTFNTRIAFSDVSVHQAYKNGYRTFKALNHVDYPTTYGSLTKMLEWGGNIIAVFEHGVACIPVNERALAAQGAGGNVFTNTAKILPDNPNMLSDSFGSKWKDSIVQTPYAIYGIDTVAKKIWRVSVKGSLQKSLAVDVISDFKFQKFLNDNLTLSEHENQPIIGVRNVKSHYNANKGDIMFTFYDDINTIEEKAWNLCYNELLGKFMTFYSWVPSFSENIDNIFFSFDRNTSKYVSKLYSDPSYIQLKNNDGIVSAILEKGDNNKVGTLVIPNFNYDVVSTGESQMDKPTIIFSIADNTKNGQFSITNNNELCYNGTIDTVNSQLFKVPIKATIQYPTLSNTSKESGITQLEMTNIVTKANQPYLNKLENTYFWKHGQAGNTKTVDKIKPTHWYGKQHPFEIEFVVADKPASHKIFTDLCIISNNAEPESLHFEIVGDVYKFADDKPNMFFRQEAIKHLYQYHGSDILYDSRYLDIIPQQRDILYSSSQYKDKSTLFPIYYSRVDTINEIEDFYQSKCETSRDYQRMSVSEIIYDETLNEFRIATHIPARPFGKLYKKEISQQEFDMYSNLNNYFKEGDKCYKWDTYGRLNGNMHYKENMWYAQIPSILYWEKNELPWSLKSGDVSYPPLNVANNPVPESTSGINISGDSDLPKELKDLGYKADNISFDTSIWQNKKEARIRDKYIRIRIRYTGDKLAIIHAIQTLYTVSFA